ncbi:hypothetical protein [Thalassospira alkalitolerans]|uniref:hypothetical protein n=1 Tax=Thalassospira alkalitolerans TaxID=1293890 RepID=UPI003AA9AAB6
MTKRAKTYLFLGMSCAALAIYVWLLPDEIRHFTVDELVGLTCGELGEKHEEVIFAYHDASIAHYNKTSAFEDDLGLPKEEVLPFVILMRKVINDNGLSGFDLTKPFFHSASEATPPLHSEFFAEISSICATHPDLDAIEAMRQAAENLNVMRDTATP